MGCAGAETPLGAPSDPRPAKRRAQKGNLKTRAASLGALSWHVYLVRCADGTLYCGVTTDLDKRLATHNAGKGAKYTARRRPVRLAWSEPADDRGAALRREHAVKALPRRAKLALARSPPPSQAFSARRALDAP